MTYQINENYRDSVMRCATWGPISLNAFYETPGIKHITPILEQAERQQRHFPNAGSHISLMVSGIPRFPMEVRKKYAELAAITTPRLYSTASVVLLPGMLGVAAKALINTVSIMSKRSTPEKSFSSINDAVIWTQGFFPEKTWAATELVTTIENWI